MSVRRWTVVLLAALVLLAAAPDLAHACAGCIDLKSKNRAAFFATTIFMSLLPLGMASGLWLYVRRRARELAGLNVKAALQEPEVSR